MPRRSDIVWNACDPQYAAAFHQDDDDNHALLSSRGNDLRYRMFPLNLQETAGPYAQCTEPSCNRPPTDGSPQLGVCQGFMKQYDQPPHRWRPVAKPTARSESRKLFQKNTTYDLPTLLQRGTTGNRAFPQTGIRLQRTRLTLNLQETAGPYAQCTEASVDQLLSAGCQQFHAHCISFTSLAQSDGSRGPVVECTEYPESRGPFMQCTDDE